MILRDLTAARDAEKEDAGEELVTVVVPARSSHPAPS
jgi:hypothetical protein